MSSLWSYIDQYNVYFGAVAILFGALLVLFGRKFIRPAIFIAGFITCVVLALFMFYAIYYNKNSTTGAFWGILSAGVIIGILIGLLLARFIKVGAAVLAGWGGLCLGLILYQAFLFRFEQQWVFWVTISYCAVMSGVLVFFAFDVMCIVGTVALGSYAVVRGVAAYAGHYYNESQLAEMLKDGLISEVDPWYWAYVAGFVVMFLVGFGF